MVKVDISGMIKVDMKVNGLKIKCMGLECMLHPKDKLFRGFSNKIII
jgi:hypothetical protein